MTPPKAPAPFRPRLISRGGDVKIIRSGHDPLIFRDLYVNLLKMPWWLILALSAAFYLLSNVAFACIYYGMDNGVANAPTFADLFFFSVQTMATIGYGRMTPLTTAANCIVVVEALWGLFFFAFITGLIFAKFSRPTAHVLFSNCAVISPFDGEPHLKIRLANQRTNRIVDAQARMYLIRSTVTKEGYPMRRFYDMSIVRHEVPLLQLTWTLLHKIDEHSPLHGCTIDEIRTRGDEVIVTLVGLDETLAQTIHARHSYVADEIMMDAFFEDVITLKDSQVLVDYNAFHTVRESPNPHRDAIRL